MYRWLLLDFKFKITTSVSGKLTVQGGGVGQDLRENAFRKHVNVIEEIAEHALKWSVYDQIERRNSTKPLSKLPATSGTKETLESDESRECTSSGAAENVPNSSSFHTELFWWV